MLLLKSKSRSESVNNGRWALNSVHLVLWCQLVLLHHPIHSNWGKMTHCGWTYSTTCHGAFSLISLCRDIASITWLLPSPFSFITFIFFLLSYFQWFVFKNGWDYLETDREVTLWSESQIEAQHAKGSKVTFRQIYLLYKHFSIFFL